MEMAVRLIDEKSAKGKGRSGGGRRRQ